MRSLVSIFFIFCLCGPFIGSWSWLQLQKKRVKREIKWKMIAGIDKNELVLLRFRKDETASRLRWEHSREFEFQGEMYDVVESCTENDSAFFWCWWDHEETDLNKRLSQLLAEAMGGAEEDDASSGKPNLKDFIESLFVQEQEQASQSHYTQLIANFFNPEIIFKNVRPRPPLPPPKVA